MASFGDIIREARIGRFTLREFARLLGVSPTHLSDVENNRRVPSEELLSKIASHLNLNLDQLLAAAGRVPEEARRAVENNPQAVALFRTASTLDSEQLRRLKRLAEKMGQEKGRVD